MAPIPAELHYVDTVVDPATQVAHKLGNPPPADPDQAHRRQTAQAPDRWTARCTPAGGRFPPVSAFTATQRGADACPAPECFGPALAGVRHEAVSPVEESPTP